MFIATLLISVSSMLSAQLTYGTTGLLHAPSAEMQKDKTVMLGGNFMNKEITPPTWYYHTYNYFLNVTILPWMEVAYTCTLFKAEALGLKPYGYSGFTNQDRYFFYPVTGFERRTILEVYASYCFRNIRSIYFIRRRLDWFYRRKRIL